LRFPTELEVIITDTVGFIRNLPADLLKAFMATLEELQEADLLVHVVDVSNPGFREQMAVVEQILRDLELDTIPVLTLFNKIDQVEDRDLIHQIVGKEGITISALHPETLSEFLVQAEKLIGKTLDANLR
jgi:GTP-binding protein HflX